MVSPEAMEAALRDHGAEHVLESILTNARPVIFKTTEEFDRWRQELREAAKMPAAKMEIVGSASVGFSLAPEKFGRPFSRVATPDRPPSDLDLAVIDRELFLSTWDAIVREDRAFQLAITAEIRGKLVQDIYYGFISEQMAPRRSKAFSTMLAIRAASGRHVLSSGLKLNLRVYRRQEDLVGYQIASLRAVKRELGRL
jgi:hypothetical protein